MEISSAKINEAAIAAAARVKAIASDGVKQETEAAKSRPAEKDKEVKLDVEDVKTMTDALNKFMQSMNADLQFAVHDKTQQLMVQLIDTAEQKVLKEFPPRDFLDMVAKIRDYVGALLDKRA